MFCFVIFNKIRQGLDKYFGKLLLKIWA